MTRFLTLAVALSVALACVLVAQPPVGPNERQAPKRTNPQDKEDIWMLDFKYKPIRVFTADIPGRGKTVVWYLWYQVSNQTGAPRFFNPYFELVTLDRNTVHVDEVLPAVQAAIAKQEDPTGYLNIKNSVTIGQEPIPASKPDAAPRYVTGIAIFPDVAKRAPDTTRFSIFVSGLSNGWTVDDNRVIRRKTLQLNFKRLTDAEHQDSQDIKFVGPEEWVYRATSVTAPKVKPAEVPKAPEKKVDFPKIGKGR